MSITRLKTTKKKGQHDCKEKETTTLYVRAGKTFTSFLMAGLSKCWWLGRHFNIFLLTGISNINNFFINKKKNVVVHENIYD